MSHVIDLTHTDSAREPWHVLVVEDSAADAELVMELFDDPVMADSFRVTRVERLAFAVEYLSRAEVDCVVLDLSLPDSRGLATVRAVRDAAPDVAIVVLTGLMHNSLGAAAIQLGVQDYIVKNELNAKVLERSATYAIERQRQRVALRDASEALSVEVVTRELAEAELRHSTERYRQIVELAQEGIWAFDTDGLTTFVNPRMAEILGCEADEMIGASLGAFMDDEGRRIAAANSQLDARSAIDGRHDFVLRRRDGTSLWAIMATTEIFDGRGELIGSLAMVTDVTQRKQQAAALLEAKTRFQNAFDSAPTGMALIELDGHFMEVNPALIEMLGFQGPQLLAMSVSDLVHIDDVEQFRDAFDHLGDRRQAFRLECRLIGIDEREVWALVSGATVDDAIGRHTHSIVQAEDITSRKVAEARLVHQTLHDPLTGLPNRMLLQDRLEHALARLDRTIDSVGVLYIDVDRFKVINDTLGHARGDELLAEIGRRLIDVVRPSDTVARLGGDEFVILVENLAGRDDVSAVAERIRRSMRTPVRLGGTDVVVQVSIGIALATDRHREPEPLLREADMAMYRAKECGKDRYEIFDDALRARAMERLGTETTIRRALDGDNVVVVYQPVIDMTTGATIGVEALVRIDDEEQGLLMPADFVGAAEDTGLIVPLGEVVLRKALDQASIWRNHGNGTPFKVHVNLSARQLALPTLAETIAGLLRERDIPAQHLTLELTESILLDSASSTLRGLTDLKSLGVDLGVDDFGTGYSSLTYLRRFPVDFVKIDKSFVSGLPVNPDDDAIVKAVIGLGQALGLTTIAEGVETEEQLARLRALGCDMAQGYYFAKPQPSAAMSNLLAAAAPH